MSIFRFSIGNFTRALAFWLLLSGITPLYASDYYWIGGTGNWSDINHWATTSGGSTKHVVVPSPNDHVYFDANSFTGPNQYVNVDLSIAACKNLTVNNVADTPVFQGGNQLKIYGSLGWSRKMKWLFSGKVFFEAVNPGNTIQTDSIIFTNDVIFQGLGGSWTLLNVLNSGQRIFLEYGSLNTNGKTIECTGFFSTSSNTRGLTLGSSVIKLADYWSVNLQNLTLSAGQSKISFSNDGTFASTGSGTGTYHIVYFNQKTGTSTLTSTQSVFTSVRFAGSGNISGNNNFDTLFFTPGSNYVVNGISSIFKKFDADGNCVSPIGISGSWALTMPASAIFLANYIKMTGVTATGGANFSTYGSTDLGGNTGINFIPLTPYVLYWVGGSGEWNDTTHWSYSSGGPGGACIPTAIDDVWFDANSFSMGDSVSISNLVAECHDLHWVSIPDSIKLNKIMDLFIHGSVWLHHNLIWNGGASQTFFVSNQPGETILSDQVVLTGPVFFDGNGSWTLLDDFEIDGHGVEHQTGTWNTNGKRVKIGVYHSFTGNQRVLNLGSSHFIVYTSHVQAWTLMGLNYTLNAGTSTVDIAGPNGGIYNSSSFGLTYYHVIYSDTSGLGQLNTDQNNFFTLTFKSNGFIRGLNTIGTLNFTKGKDYNLAYNNTQTIQTQLNAIGGCDGYILIHSDEKDYTTTISKASGIVNCEYLIMWNVNATGGAVFNAFNSVDVAMNTGWNFTSPTAKNLYWVGGTGNWSDVMHWSLTSGGVGGACVPSPLDSVFFDGNSFLAANDTVYVDLTNATCHTMTWMDSLIGAILYGDAYKTMWFWGSVIFDTAMSNQFLGLAMFEASDTGHILVSASNWYNLDVIFEGRGGSWAIVDSLSVMRNILLKHGAVNGAGKLIKASSIRSPLSSKRGLDISSAEVQLFGSTTAWELMHDSLLFDATASELIFLSPGFVDFNNYSGLPDTADFHNITFVHDFSFASMFSNNIYCRINVATYGGNGNFNESFRYDSLMMTGGHTYKFAGGTTQTFNHISADGSCFRPIVFTPLLPVSPPAPQYTLHNLGAAAQINYVTIDGCTGIGPSAYLATNSVNNGANVNWTVTTVGPVDLYWVNGTGLWWDPYHWSYTSGGVGGACIPTFRDNVFFDQNSFLTPQDTVRVDSLFAECHDMQWININTNPTFRLPGVPLEIHGALRLDTAINGNFEGKIRFLSNHGGNYIYCGSQTFRDSVVFLGSGTAAWTLYDSLTTTEPINLIRGDLNTNGQTVSARVFVSFTSNPRTLTLDTTLFRVKTLWRISGTNLNLNAGHSTIQISAGNNQMISENGTGFHYHNVIFTSITGTSLLRTNIAQTTYNKVQINNNGTILGEHLFDSLLMMPGNLYMLEKGKTQTITSYWLLRGNNCFPLTLQSTQLGQQATVKKTAGQVIGDFVHMRDIAAIGGATFFAGDNSSDVSNNTGWNFNNSPGYIFGLGPDIQFTIGSTITLSTANFNGGPGTTYQWSNGATTPNITVSQPDTYIVTVTYAGNCVVIDTIIVFCDVKPQFSIGHCICFGDNTGWINMAILDTVGTYTAVWSNGANQLNLTGLTAGQYSVIVYGSTGCNGRDTIQIHEPPPVIVPLNDTSFCEDDTGVLLDATSAFSTYWWNGVPGGQSIFVNQEDTIVVVVEDADGCRSAPDTIVVTIDTIPWIWLGDDAEICLGESLILNPGAGFDSYLWQDGSSKQMFTATQGGTYFVTIKLRTCVNHDTILLFDCPPEIFFPNVFTPNGDGTNDFFYPIHQNIYRYQLVIFNRWGGIVFSSDDPYEKWDGTSNGIPNSEGTYFYTVDYLGFGQRAIPGKKLHRGTVTLLR